MKNNYKDIDATMHRKLIRYALSDGLSCSVYGADQQLTLKLSTDEEKIFEEIEKQESSDVVFFEDNQYFGSIKTKLDILGDPDETVVEHSVGEESMWISMFIAQNRIEYNS